MEQQHFRVAWSLGTKLLISVVSLLLMVILFINISAIFMLTEDKRAYTYQAQGTQALLMGREWVGKLNQGFASLKIGLSAYDPGRQVSEKDRAQVKNVIENQSALVSLSLGRWEGDPTPRFLEKLSYVKSGASALDAAEQSVDPAAWPAIIEGARNGGYGFVNLSKPGRPASIGLVFRESESSPNIAFGVMSLDGFNREERVPGLTITDLGGNILFSSDSAQLYGRGNVGEDALFRTATHSAVASGATEFDRGSDHFLGSYFRPGLGSIVLIRQEWRKVMRATYALSERFILLGGIAVGAAMLFAILFSKSLTAPLTRLYDATREVAAGRFDLTLPPAGRDEIGALSTSFVTMSKKIQHLIQESVRKVHLENELAIASTVQQTLIPPEKFRNEHLEIFSHYQSAAECGGDWWGYFGVGKHVCVMISDATGHGLPSALITSAARACFSVMHKLAQEDPAFTFSPGSMLSYANRVIHDSASGKIMMTFFVGVIDLEAKTLTYSSAGHNPPWLVSGATGPKPKHKSLVVSGQRLGEAREVPDFEEKTVPLAEGDILFLYTDGLMEGRDLAGEMYGKKRTRKIVDALIAKGPDALIAGLVKEFKAHNQGKDYDDDITLAAIRLLKFSGST